MAKANHLGEKWHAAFGSSRLYNLRMAFHSLTSVMDSPQSALTDGRRGSFMKLEETIDLTPRFLPPPPGARNIRLGKRIDGPGGDWIPCATVVGPGVYLSGLFRVGPGQRQICAVDRPTGSVDEALEWAIELAKTAAA